jgi:hypothetical protein
MTTIEKATLAAKKALNEGPAPGYDTDRMERVVRAVLEVIREPSGSMTHRGAFTITDISFRADRASATKLWYAMIDQILNEKG